jgi:hypothetical protein
VFGACEYEQRPERDVLAISQGLSEGLHGGEASEGVVGVGYLDVVFADHVVEYREVNAAQVVGKCHYLVELNLVLATDKNGGSGQGDFLDDP